MIDPAPQVAQGGFAPKKERILEAAARCFARLGFVKTTVEEIAQAAGVSKGLVYVHFAGKEALLEAVLERTLEEWREATRSALAGQTSVCSALIILHRASIEYALRHPLLRRILDRDAYLLLSHVDAPARRGMERWRLELTELLARGVAAGELRPDLDLERTADVIRLLHLSYLERLFDDDLIDVADPKLVEAGMAALLHGIAAH